MFNTRNDSSGGVFCFSFTIVHSLLMAASHSGPKNVALCWEVLLGDEERGNGPWSRCLSSHCGQFHAKKTRFEVTTSKTSFFGPNLLVRPHVVH